MCRATSKKDELPDRTTFYLDKKGWEAFLLELNSPPKPLPKLVELMRRPSVFEKDE